MPYTTKSLRSGIHYSVTNGLQLDPDYISMKENSRTVAMRSLKLLNELSDNSENDISKPRDSIKSIPSSDNMKIF